MRSLTKDLLIKNIFLQISSENHIQIIEEKNKLEFEVCDIYFCFKFSKNKINYFFL